MFEYEDNDYDLDTISEKEKNISETIRIDSIVQVQDVIENIPEQKKQFKEVEKQVEKQVEELAEEQVEELAEEKELSADDIEELKELIKNWLNLDEKCKILADETKDIKMEKKQYETYILGFMEKTNKDIIKTNDSTLRKNVKESKGAPKEEHILKTLTKILENAEQAYKITQQILEDIPSKEVISLKKDKCETKKTKKISKLKKKDI